MKIYPGWVDDLVEQIDMTPGDIREQVVQEAVEEAGEAKGLRWIPYLQELHTIYLTRVKEEKREEKRWAWLKVFLEKEPPHEQNTILQILIKAMATQQGAIVRESGAELSSLTSTVIENHMRQILIAGSLADVELPQIIALLSRVQEGIEKERGLAPGTLMREVVKASKPETKVLHLHARVLKVNVGELCNRIEFLLGKGQTVLILDMPGLLDDERTIYYQQPLSVIPYESGVCITDQQLIGVLRTIEFDQRCLKFDFTINENDGIEVL